MQPIVKFHNKDYHLECYLKKDGSKLLTRPVLDDITRRLECMSKICANALDGNSSLEERNKTMLNKILNLEQKIEAMLEKINDIT